MTFDPLFSFIDFQRRIAKEKETRGLDEYQAYTLALEAMKLDCKKSMNDKLCDDLNAHGQRLHVVELTGDISATLNGEDLNVINHEG